MKRLLFVTAAALGVAALAGCGGPEVVVQAQLASEGNAEARPLADLPVRLVPYDRDVVFDSLEQAFERPQPAIPDSLLRLEEQIAAANEEWQQAEAAWIGVRDSLRTISQRLQGMSRANPQYRALFNQFNDLEPQERQLRQRSEAAFGRFTQLQSRYNTQAEEIRALREQWADEAFADVDTVIGARLRQLDREEYTDTTDANGVARFQARPGRWWVYARYPLPYQELYWNVPIEVQRGEDTQVPLTRENAELRPRL